ncbi:MAG: ATP-binding protein [bacterium]
MTTNVNQNPISTQLRKLFLGGMADTLEVRLQQAKEGQWPYGEFLSRLLEDEVERRAQKQLAGRLKRAGLESAKTLEAFQFSFNPEVPRQQVLELATCSFIQKKRNVVLCGPTGVGSRQPAAACPAQAIGHQACRMGLEVWLVAAEQLLRRLHGGRADGVNAARICPTFAG